MSVVNIGAYIVYLLILRRLIRSPWQFACVGISSVVGIAFCNPLSLTMLPSALGFRYLPSMLFLYYLISAKNDTIPDDKLSSKTAIGLLYLNALWSIESLIFVLAIAGFYEWIKYHDIKQVFKTLCRLLLRLTVFTLVFFVMYWVFFKQFPRYDVYLEYPFSYLTGRHDEGAFTDRVGYLSDRYLFLLPMALVSFVLF
ncbi:MAG: hypothetical protein RLZ35_905, partial [Pseudomonadota bacterium]